MSRDDVSYFLELEGDRIPIISSMTMGNHLDNDIVVAGEDVSDYHVRIELTDRGPTAIPLVNSIVSVNGRDTENPVRVIFGDEITIGQVTMRVDAEATASLSDAELDWHLHSAPDGAPFGASEAGAVALRGVQSIGRSRDVDITINDDHISRHHARFVVDKNAVWLQDLDSANGTRVNGESLVGGVRLFHGDYIGFDRCEYQLIGKGGDLTPLNAFEDPLKGTVSKQASPPQIPVDTTEFLPIAEPHDAAPPTIPEIREAGAFLLGICEPVDGKVMRMAVGESVIGRDPQCSLRIDDPTVSHVHAQLHVRPENVTITNLKATNGTRVNGDEIVSVELVDGDVIRLGRVGFVYKEVPSEAIEQLPAFRKARAVLLSAALGMALVIALIFLT